MMETVPILGSKQFDAKMAVHIVTQNTEVSLALKFQKHLSNESRKHGIIDNGRKVGQVNKSVQTYSIMCNIINISIIKT